MTSIAFGKCIHPRKSALAVDHEEIGVECVSDLTRVAGVEQSVVGGRRGEGEMGVIVVNEDEERCISLFVNPGERVTGGSVGNPSRCGWNNLVMGETALYAEGSAQCSGMLWPRRGTRRRYPAGSTPCHRR